MGREGQNFARTVREAIFIKVNNPTLNRNIGKYNMPHICDGVLFNTPECRMKNKQELQEQQVHGTSLAPSKTSRTYKIVENNNVLRADEGTLHEW